MTLRSVPRRRRKGGGVSRSAGRCADFSLGRLRRGGWSRRGGCGGGGVSRSAGRCADYPRPLERVWTLTDGANRWCCAALCAAERADMRASHAWRDALRKDAVEVGPAWSVAHVDDEQERPLVVRQHTSAYGSIRQHTSTYVSIRQHTSAYVSIIEKQRFACR